ncbi:MAG: GldG family protein, partial [Proteobacteria bacterium]|nr:GldG family protein [Pseudomonadota bacterium]
MELNRKTRLQFRIQHLIFLALFLTIIGLLAWLSQRYSVESDWTATGRNTLSEASVRLLERMPEPVTIVAFARDTSLVPTRRNVEELIRRYQIHKPDITLNFINPDTEPEQTRAQNITVDGELVISYGNRTEHVTVLQEEAITNTLARLLRSGEKHIVFLTGHGERRPDGEANHDYGQFMKHLANKGLKAVSLNLIEEHTIPADTAVLVIASPQTDYLAGEIKLIQNYLQQGGNLLWLHEPGSLHGLDTLAQTLEIRFVPGVIVDPTTQLLGIKDPSFALVTRYGDNPVTKDFKFMSIFPRASGIQFLGKSEPEADHSDGNRTWVSNAILLTVERSWSESDALEGVVEYTQGSDTLGPLAIGLALHRNKPATSAPTRPDSDADPTPNQRVVVLGDGDFLSNTYLGNQGNQDLGYNILNWLSNDDAFISIP